jgi:hypothetical protein
MTAEIDEGRDMAERQVFGAVLKKDDQTDATHIQIPFDVPAAFGARGRVAVRGTLNGMPFRASLFPYGGIHYLGVNRALREQTGLKVGDQVNVWGSSDSLDMLQMRFSGLHISKPALGDML